MTGNIETHPKQKAKNTEKQKPRNWVIPFWFIFVNANNPPTHPTMKIPMTMRGIINPIESIVPHPNMNHLINGMMLLYGIPSPMPDCMVLKYLFNAQPMAR